MALSLLNITYGENNGTGSYVQLRGFDERYGMSGEIVLVFQAAHSRRSSLAYRVTSREFDRHKPCTIVIDIGIDERLCTDTVWLLFGLCH